ALNPPRGREKQRLSSSPLSSLLLRKEPGMLSIFGKSSRLCDGTSRRDFLALGTLGMGGLTLANLLRLKAQGANDIQKSSKAVIMLFLQGGPSHIDMYDLKPNAPVDYRGEFKPIQTNVPGMDICEHMPLQAKIAGKL